MFDKALLAVNGFITDFLNQIGPSFLTDIGKIARIEMPECSLFQGEFIGELGPDGYFHALYGIHDQESQLAVKRVPPPDLLEGGARFQRVILLTKRIPIGAEPVVADVAEVNEKCFAIGNYQAATNEEVGLLVEG